MIVFFSNLIDTDELRTNRDPEMYQYPDSEPIRVKPNHQLLIILDELIYPSLVLCDNTWVVDNSIKYVACLIQNNSNQSLIIEQGCCLREIIEQQFINYVIGCVSDNTIIKAIF